MESKILSLCVKSCKSFETIRELIKRDYFSPEGELLWKTLERYYERDEDAVGADFEIISTYVKALSPKHGESLCRTLQGLYEIETSEANLVDILREARLEDVRFNLQASIMNPVSSLEDCGILWNEYKDLREGLLGEESIKGTIYECPSLENIIESNSQEKRIKLWPPQLNAKLDGGILKQHHIILFGRPEIGKSTLSLSIAQGFVRQKLRVLYVGNEDPANAMLLRFAQSLLRISLPEIRLRYKELNETLIEKGFHRLIFAELPGGSLADIRKLLTKFTPIDILIVDQIRNLSSWGENAVIQKEETAKGIRRLIKEFNCVGVSVTQAGESAHNKNYLDLNDIDGSKTGVPGTADLMLGLGANEDYKLSNKRMLSLPKNKISVDKNPELLKIYPEYGYIE